MSNVFSKHNATKKIEVPLTEANFRVLLQPLQREGRSKRRWLVARTCSLRSSRSVLGAAAFLTTKDCRRSVLGAAAFLPPKDCRRSVLGAAAFLPPKDLLHDKQSSFFLGRQECRPSYHSVCSFLLGRQECRPSYSPPTCINCVVHVS